MVRLRIDLAYDGAPFSGFARQQDHKTVQGVLEGALHRVLGRHRPDGPVVTTGAGRTDAGVHAEAQTVHVDVPPAWRFLDDLEGLRHALDKLCGDQITVWRVRRVPASFDARFSATQRRYRYRLCDDRAMPPLWHPDTWHVPPTLDVAAMETAGQALVGEHDFTSFCRRKVIRWSDGTEHEQTRVRRVHLVSVRRSRPAGLVLVRVHGSAFCHNMVRAITGSLVEVGAGRQPVGWIADVLAAQDRSVAGPVAPPQGLSLVGVRYT
jgi:tRNA pseudouridine38-40 synthase